VTELQTDEEKVEAIKKWWRENGKSVVGGVVLGFAIIGGWQGWQIYRTNQGEQASLLFDAMSQAAAAGRTDAAVSEGQRLVGEYPGSAYASLAAMQLARLAYQRGEKSAARDHLRWVVESGPDAELREIARLRLGMLLLDMQQLDALDALLAEPGLVAFAGEFAALRGDLAKARGDLASARSAYAEALAVGVEDAALLRMKLVDVGGRLPAG
jgi:predicted negative regulator of RcsB-dependent stress response